MFSIVRDTLQVDLEMMGLHQGMVESGTFEIHYNSLGGIHILAMVTHIWEILRLPW